MADPWQRQCPECMILVGVDDFIVATKPSFRKEMKELLGERFQFGKWEADKAEYAGRSIIMHASKEKIEIGQEKYIIENLRPMHLAKGRRSDKTSPLSETESKEHRSLLYKMNWVAKESRPEATSTVSILATRLHVATVGDAIILKAVTEARSGSKRTLTICKHDLFNMSFISSSDAAGAGAKPVHHTSLQVAS